MNELKYDIEKYAKRHLEEGYDLSATTRILVPWFECTVRCVCVSDRSITEVDKVFCMCVEEGINTPEDISFVLSLDLNIVRCELEELVSCGLLQADNEIFSFSAKGVKLYNEKKKSVSEVLEFKIYMNAVTGEWQIEDDGFSAKSEGNDDGIALMPIKEVPVPDTQTERALSGLLMSGSEMNILSLNLLDYKKLVYKGETILFYGRGSDETKFEIFDDDKEDLDFDLTSALMKAYDKNEILELTQARRYLKEGRRSLLNSFQEKGFISEDDSRAQDIQYLRNQQIRELLLKELDEARESLFIISPWMNEFVINADFIKKLENALKRGVNIEIGFGYIAWEKLKYRIEKEYQDKEVQSFKVGVMLFEKFKKYDNFHIFYVNEGTHEKVFCFDDDNVLLCSMNLLSYDGGQSERYSGLQFRLEGGMLFRNRNIAENIKRLFAGSVRPVEKLASVIRQRQTM